MKTLIYLIRHGESLGNATGLVLGHTDLDLSEHGYKQAEVTAEALSDVRFDAIYSSDLKRAMNTAAPHARLRGMDVVPCMGLREMYIGDWEGRHKDDVDREYGDMLARYFGDEFGTFEIPSGESTQGACNRFYAALAEIAALVQSDTYKTGRESLKSSGKGADDIMKQVETDGHIIASGQNTKKGITSSIGQGIGCGNTGKADACEGDLGRCEDFTCEKRTILVAAHAAVIRAFWARICGIKPEQIGAELKFPTNASYSMLEFDGEKFTPIAYSVDNHLVEIGITKL